MDTETIPKESIDKFRAFVRKEFIVILVLLVALLACTWTIYTVNDFQVRCNEHWMNEIENNSLISQNIVDKTLLIPFNESYRFIPFGNENKK